MSDTDKNTSYKGDTLTEEEKKVMWEKGTEAPFSGKHLEENGKGVYRCKVCGNPLFRSDTKFKSDVPGLKGWPSFDDAIKDALEFKEDKSTGMNRTEVLCKKCGAHLGHVFEEPQETKTGKHYCINSVCLELEKEE